MERVILTIKCLLRCLPLVSYRREAFLRELLAATEWYNESRPHTRHSGKTPNEVYFGRFPASRRPRFEPRSSGHEVRRVRSLGPWCEAAPARNSRWKLAFTAAASTCLSSNSSELPERSDCSFMATALSVCADDLDARRFNPNSQRTLRCSVSFVTEHGHFDLELPSLCGILFSASSVV